MTGTQRTCLHQRLSATVSDALPAVPATTLEALEEGKQLSEGRGERVPSPESCLLPWARWVRSIVEKRTILTSKG